MLQRVVMWRLKDPARSDEFIDLLRGLDGHAGGVHSMQIHKNINKTSAAHDVLFWALFESEEHLRVFERDQVHARIAKQINTMRETRHVVDCVVDD